MLLFISLPYFALKGKIARWLMERTFCCKLSQRTPRGGGACSLSFIVQLDIKVFFFFFLSDPPNLVQLIFPETNNLEAPKCPLGPSVSMCMAAMAKSDKLPSNTLYMDVALISNIMPLNPGRVFPLLGLLPSSWLTLLFK